jgi:hypothetical protein
MSVQRDQSEERKLSETTTQWFVDRRYGIARINPNLLMGRRIKKAVRPAIGDLTAKVLMI